VNSNLFQQIKEFSTIIHCTPRPLKRPPFYFLNNSCQKLMIFGLLNPETI